MDNYQAATELYEFQPELTVDTVSLEIEPEGSCLPDNIPAPSSLGADYWSYLYQQHQCGKLCDIHLCIRDVSESGDLPVTHSIPAHKLVLTAGSQFFRRCLDNGDLLDMYNFDGVQPHNLQLLVDYLYHQTTWEHMTVNKEAAEVARILEVIQYEDLTPSSTSPQQLLVDQQLIGNQQGKKVLIVKKTNPTQDSSSQEVEQELLISDVKLRTVRGTDRLSKPKPKRIIVANLQEEYKKHNLLPVPRTRKPSPVKSTKRIPTYQKTALKLDNKDIYTAVETSEEIDYVSESGEDEEENVVCLDNINIEFERSGETVIMTVQPKVKTEKTDLYTEPSKPLEEHPQSESQVILLESATDQASSQAPEEATEEPENINQSQSNLRPQNYSTIRRLLGQPEGSLSVKKAAKSKKPIKSPIIVETNLQMEENESYEVVEDVVDHPVKTERLETPLPTHTATSTTIATSAAPAAIATGKVIRSQYNTRFKSLKHVPVDEVKTSSGKKKDTSNFCTIMSIDSVIPKLEPIDFYPDRAVDDDPPLNHTSRALKTENVDDVSTGGSKDQIFSHSGLFKQLKKGARSKVIVLRPSMEATFKTLTEPDQKPTLLSVTTTDEHEEENENTSVMMMVEDEPLSNVDKSPQQTTPDLKPRVRATAKVKQVVDPERPFVCSICKKCFKNNTGLSIHEQWKHGKTDAVGSNSQVNRQGDIFHQCEHCQKVCSSYQALVQHMRMVHGSVPSRKCEDCPETFRTIRDLKSHQIKVHGAEIYKCDKCNISFKSPEGFKIHMYKQHSDAEKSLVCAKCGKSFTMKHELSTHLKVTHAEERAFSCMLCTRSFKNKPSLKRHLATYHTDLRTFACPVCQLLFKTRTDMNNHRLKHSGKSKKQPQPVESDFTCQQCGKSFRKQYQLGAHERLIHREKALGTVYVCTVCKKSFAAKNYLLQHVRQRHMPRRYKCTQCQYEFVHAYMLKKHLPKCKRCPMIAKPFRCGRCNRYFNLKGNLTRHLRTPGRCRGFSQYADYVLMVSGSQGELTSDGLSGVSVEALQASEALQQLHSSGAVQPGEQQAPDEEQCSSVTAVIEQTVEGTGEVVTIPVDIQTSSDVHGTYADTQDSLETLRDVINLPKGLQTMNVEKDEDGNYIIEVSGSATDLTEALVVDETGMAENYSADSAVETLPAGSYVVNEQLQQMLETPSGDIVLQDITGMQGTAPSGQQYIQQLVEEAPAEVEMEAVEIDHGQLGSITDAEAYQVTTDADGTQVYHIIQEGDLQQLVSSQGIQDGQLQLIHGEDGSIQLLRAGGDSVQVVHSSEVHTEMVFNDSQEDILTQMNVKEELVEETISDP